MQIIIPNILAGGGGRAMQEAGSSMMAAANANAKMASSFIKEIQAEVQKQSDFVEGVQIETEMLQKKQEHFDKAKRGAGGSKSDDPTKRNASGYLTLQAYVDEDNRIGAEYQSKATNGRVSQYLQRSHLTSQRQYSIGYQKELDEALYNDSITTTKTAVDRETKTAIQTGEFGMGLQNIGVIVESQRGYFGPKTEDLKKSMLEQYTETYMRTALADPVRAPMMLELLADPNKKTFFFSMLKADKIDEMVKVIESAKKNANETTAYIDATQQWPEPGQAAIGVLTPDFIKKHNLTIQQSQNIAQSFRAIIAQNEQAQTATFYKTATDIFLNLRSMTSQKIDNIVLAGKLDYKTAEHFKAELRQVGEGRTDPATYDRFLQDIYSDAKGPEAIRMEIYRTGGLSRADKEKLLTKTEAKIEKIDARNLSRAMQYLKETVMPSQTMVTAAKPDEALNYLKATEAMEAAVVEARKAGKPLNSKQVIETAQEISQTFKMSTREQMEAARKRMQEDAKKLKPTAAGPAKQPQTGPKVLKYNPATGNLE